MIGGFKGPVLRRSSTPSKPAEEPEAVAGSVAVVGACCHHKPCRYKKVIELNKGSFGTVWKVELEADFMTQYNLSSSAAALKEVDLTAHGTYSARAQKEMMLIREARSPNIVRLIKYHRSMPAKSSHLFMELMDRGSLVDVEARLRLRDGRSSLCVDRNLFAKAVGVQLLMGLQYMHIALKAIHRDVKKGNLLLDSSGHLKLCDFDFSFDMLNSQLAAPSTAGGTEETMAPEIVKKLWRDPTKMFDAYDEKCDVWSAGVVLYQLATGKAPVSLQAIFKQAKEEQELALQQHSSSNRKKCCWEDHIDFEAVHDEQLRGLLKGMLVEDPGLRMPAGVCLLHTVFRDLYTPTETHDLLEQCGEALSMLRTSSDGERGVVGMASSVSDDGDGVERRSLSQTSNSFMPPSPHPSNTSLSSLAASEQDGSMKGSRSATDEGLFVNSSRAMQRAFLQRAEKELSRRQEKSVVVLKAIIGRLAD